MNALPGSRTARTLKPLIMKSILYAGAALMIGASIYGFADYKKNHNKKEFTGMYNETQVQPVTKKEVAVVEKNNDAPAPAPEVKNFAPKKEVKAEKSMSKDEKPAVGEKKPEAGTSDAKDKPEENVKKKNKKIRREIFSRAPLRYEDEETEDEPLKAEDSEKVDTTKI